MSDSIDARHEDNEAANLYTTFRLSENLNCIRVLEIVPANTHAFDTSLRANIKVVNLDDKPDFTALSYVWGMDQQPRTIRCDSFDVNITHNCYDALSHLRKKLGRLTIWVDAICINQQDDNEKIHQIALMQTIYGQATTVYGWLGMSNERSNRAMTYLTRAGLPSYFCAGDDADGTRRPRSQPWRAAVSLFFRNLTCSFHPFPADGMYFQSSMYGSHANIRFSSTFTTTPPVLVASEASRNHVYIAR